MENTRLATLSLFHMYKIRLYIWVRQCIQTMSSVAPLPWVVQAKYGSSALAVSGDDDIVNGRRKCCPEALSGCRVCGMNTLFKAVAQRKLDSKFSCICM